MQKRIKVSASKNARMRYKNRITAADDDFEMGEEFEEDIDNDPLEDTLDNVADTVEDIQDSVDDIEQDPVNIDVDNNITDHFIAECEKCKNIFISAMLESGQEVKTISGECPICGEECEQYLKWVIKEVSYSVEEPESDLYMHNQL